MKENFVISIWLYLIQGYCYWCCHTNLKRLKFLVHPIPKGFLLLYLYVFHTICVSTIFPYGKIRLSSPVSFSILLEIGVPAKNLNLNKLQIFCLLASCQTNNKSMLPNTFDSAICIVMCVVATRSNCCPSCGQLLSIPFPTCQ